MAKIVFVFVFIVVTASLDSARGLSNTTWDFFVFSEISPGGDCYMKNGLSCSKRSDLPNWIMHGIWPSTWSGEDNPSYCKNTTFDVTKVMDLLPQLMKVWPTLGSPSHWDYHCSHNLTQYMWCHEWLKHGTCATGIPQMSTERGFFSEVLNLFQKRMKYDTFVLGKYGIHPSTTRSYQLKDFVSAFNNAWNVNPVIRCNYNTKNDHQVLDSIRTCMDPTFSLMRCPDSVYDEHNCDSREPIYYYPAT